MSDARSRRQHVTSAAASTGMTQLDSINSSIADEIEIIDHLQGLKERVDDQIDTVQTQNSYFNHDDDKKEDIQQHIRSKNGLNNDIKRRQHQLRLLRAEASGLRGKSSKRKSSKKKKKHSRKKKKHSREKKKHSRKKHSRKKKRRTRR